MTRRLLLRPICLAAMGLLLATSSLATGDDRGFASKYNLLVEKSIFSRTRPRPATTRPTSGPALRPTQQWVLVGTLQPERDSGFVAFIENVATGATTRASAGDVIAQGSVTAVGFNVLEYLSGDRPVIVEVGQNLEGTASSNLATATGETPTTQPAAEATQPTGPRSDVLERMRQRRLQEMKR